MNTKRGIISTVILIIIALIILGYFNISFKSLFESPIVQDNLKYAWQLVVGIAKNGWQWTLDIIPKLVSDIKSS